MQICWSVLLDGEVSDDENEPSNPNKKNTPPLAQFIHSFIAFPFSILKIPHIINPILLLLIFKISNFIQTTLFTTQ